MFIPNNMLASLPIKKTVKDFILKYFSLWPLRLQMMEEIYDSNIAAQLKGQ